MFDRYAKAITGAIIAALGAYATAASDASVTAPEWAVIGIAFFAALGLVWAIPSGGQPMTAYPPTPDTVTTVNVDRGPLPTTATSEVNVRPGSGGRIVNGDYT